MERQSKQNRKDKPTVMYLLFKHLQFPAEGSVYVSLCQWTTQLVLLSGLVMLLNVFCLENCCHWDDLVFICIDRIILYNWQSYVNLLVVNNTHSYCAFCLHKPRLQICRLYITHWPPICELYLQTLHLHQRDIHPLMSDFICHLLPFGLTLLLTVFPLGGVIKIIHITFLFGYYEE